VKKKIKHDKAEKMVLSTLHRVIRPSKKQPEKKENTKKKVNINPIGNSLARTSFGKKR